MEPWDISNPEMLMSLVFYSYIFYCAIKFSVLPPLNIRYWSPLEKRWGLLDQREYKNVFRMKFVCIFVGTLTSNIVAFGAQKTHTWSHSSQCIHYEGLFVVCGLWCRGIIGHYFIENEDGATITVSGDTYRNMITDCFVPAHHDIDVNDVLFL